MELNEVTENLPPHLLQFVVDQPYDEYTPVDQAVWRYVMRQNYNYLKKVAHESYVQGLHMTGVDVEQIPTMYGMNRILKDIGWAAVAVDGFIPPGAFMEFTKYNVLVIAADIRTLEHIEYTPAPDVIHESAGHAPILAVPEFAAYLKEIGEAGSKAFSSQEDFALYEAIRHLSIIKEDPNTPASEVIIAEKEIERIQSNMGPTSEMALIRNLHWWTVEYGLIGTVEKHKIYGAGLLSSIGESMTCLEPTVRKIPYSLQAMNCNYDITKPQPQLFVTPDFAHLTAVLNEFKKTMGWIIGGVSGMRKAIASKYTATAVFSSGLQVSGTFTDVVDDGRNAVFIRTTGPSALSLNNVQLENYGKEKFPNGFSSPVGKVKLEKVEIDNDITLDYENGVRVKGVVKDILRHEGNIALIDLANATVTYGGELLEQALSYSLAIGERIISAYAGPADPEAFEPNVNVPREKMHQPTYDAKALELHELYRKVRNARNKAALVSTLPAIWEEVTKKFPGDWLLSLEILEVLQMNSVEEEIQGDIRRYLEDKKERQPDLKKLISNGLMLLKDSLQSA
ncbi:MAG TPA: aromatic amino acid hydroxylase [Cyclobacteriaceae bacterium]|nr:aromatic amino acid hydroxylase [Cyclobacteriaceae bacterium]